MRATRFLVSCVLAVTVGLVVSACGDDAEPEATEAPVTTVAPTTAAPTTVAPTTAAPTTVAPTTAAPTTAAPTTVAPTTVAPTTAAPTSTVPAGLEQPAVWPAADVVFATPEEAAADFVSHVFGDGPVLGEFMAGDSRSGEMMLFAGDPTTGEPLGEARSVLFLRQLGPDSGWFVIGAGSDLASIDSPETGDEVTAGPVTVTGEATGFEANVGLRAFRAGDAATEYDSTSTMAGNFGEVLPYSAVLDLTGAQPGEVVVLLVHGGVGLETDPGDMSAIPVVIAG